MRRVYVAGAYSAPNVTDVLSNMRRGLRLSVEVLQAGFCPFCPWIDFQFGLLDDITIDQYYRYSLAWLEVSDAVLVVPEGAEKSKGTQAEIKRAEELAIPVFWGLEDVKGFFAAKDSGVSPEFAVSELDDEVGEVVGGAIVEINSVMRAAVRKEKHKCYSWRREHSDEHLRKAARHILTHQLVRDNQQAPTGENHLSNALTRLAMATILERDKSCPSTQ